MSLDTIYNNGVSVTFEAGSSGTQTKTYDLLVVACDPRALGPVADYSQAETDVFDRLRNFNFHTTLVTMKRKGTAEYGVIFSPERNEAMTGDIYAFRNETAKQYGMAAANALDENVFTIYQIAGEYDTKHKLPIHKWTAAKFEHEFNAQIDHLHWWDHGGVVKIHKTMTTPYFDHFSPDDIKAEWPWKYLGLQGKSNTLFVHASSCFESALHCWGYIKDLVETYDPAVNALPSDKPNAKIAIIGAGVSGILAANRLVRIGYHPDNIDLLEKTERFGGKTHTVYLDGPCPPGGQKTTVCEMGTCYMSPSYDPMLKDLARYIGGNNQIDFAAKEPHFRGIDTTGEFKTPIKNGPVIPYEQYIVEKAAEIMGVSNSLELLAEVDIAEKMVEYILRHKHFFKDMMPMPLDPPTEFLTLYGDKSFREYLVAEGMEVLVPAMEYAYEVQGYGSVATIPALYGLMWVTPPIFEAILEGKIDEFFGWKSPKIVTAWTEGWEQLWAQIVTIDKLNITYKVDVKNITRS